MRKRRELKSLFYSDPDFSTAITALKLYFESTQDFTPPRQAPSTLDGSVCELTSSGFFEV